MMGGFEGNGRQRVVNVEDAGRLIVLEHKHLDNSHGIETRAAPSYLNL